MSVTTQPLSGVVLAGGQSRRLHIDKARLPLPDGRPLLGAVVDILHGVCDEVVVVADAPGRYADLGLAAREVTDVLPDRGPIGGLHAGLLAVRAPFALVVACDMPFLSPEVLAYMAGRPRSYEAMVPRVGGRWHPTHAVYSRDCLAPIEELLERGENRLSVLIDRLAVEAVTEAELRLCDPELSSLLNLNEPQDLARVEAMWRD